ncbi:MAG: alcohol dehydrogenase [Rhodospirillaceae bacterium]|nr:alcohol dehydrogenase [Rhodospirillaceae bacterium]|tara:strand:- start:700 stop:1503 length:804 start_codon:yes stop_codon:yes gene_type:complete
MGEILGLDTVVNHNNLTENQQLFGTFSNKINTSKHNCEAVVLMAGGNGKRLAPLTNLRPKPLLEVGPRPLLETTIKRFISRGFTNFWLSINYLGEMIEDHFQDGLKFGANIKYLRENCALGTAGSLSLLNKKPKKPLIIMNADILTDIDFDELLKRHKESKALATICAIEQSIQIPYGVVEEEKNYLRTLTEKPHKKYLVNAGIYVIEPEVLNYINKNTFIDMTEVIDLIKNDNKNISVYKIRDYWCDIGQKVDLEKANREFNNFFF